MEPTPVLLPDASLQGVGINASTHAEEEKVDSGSNSSKSSIRPLPHTRENMRIIYNVPRPPPDHSRLTTLQKDRHRPSSAIHAPGKISPGVRGLKGRPLSATATAGSAPQDNKPPSEMLARASTTPVTASRAASRLAHAVYGANIRPPSQIAAARRPVSARESTKTKDDLRPVKERDVKTFIAYATPGTPSGRSAYDLRRELKRLKTQAGPRLLSSMQGILPTEQLDMHQDISKSVANLLSLVNQNEETLQHPPGVDHGRGASRWIPLEGSGRGPEVSGEARGEIEGMMRDIEALIAEREAGEAGEHGARDTVQRPATARVERKGGGLAALQGRLRPSTAHAATPARSSGTGAKEREEEERERGEDGGGEEGEGGAGEGDEGDEFVKEDEGDEEEEEGRVELKVEREGGGRGESLSPQKVEGDFKDHGDKLSDLGALRGRRPRDSRDDGMEALLAIGSELHVGRTVRAAQAAAEELCGVDRLRILLKVQGGAFAQGWWAGGGAAVVVEAVPREGGGGAGDPMGEAVVSGEDGFVLYRGVCRGVLESGEREGCAVLSRHPQYDAEADEGGGMWREGRRVECAYECTPLFRTFSRGGGGGLRSRGPSGSSEEAEEEEAEEGPIGVACALRYQRAGEGAPSPLLERERAVLGRIGRQCGVAIGNAMQFMVQCQQASASLRRGSLTPKSGSPGGGTLRAAEEFARVPSLARSATSARRASVSSELDAESMAKLAEGFERRPSSASNTGGDGSAADSAGGAGSGGGGGGGAGAGGAGWKRGSIPHSVAHITFDHHTKAVLERAFEMYITPKVDEDATTGFALHKGRGHDRMSVEEFKAFLDDLQLPEEAGLDLRSAANRIFRGVLASKPQKIRRKREQELVDDKDLHREDFIHAVKVIAKETQMSVPEVVLPLMPRIASDAASAIKSTQARSKALARFSVTLTTASLEWTLEHMGQLAWQAQELMKHLLQCDELTLYHIQDSSLTLSYWEAVAVNPPPPEPTEEDIVKELLEMFTVYAQGGPDIESLISRTFTSSRSETMSLSEFIALLKALDLVPKKVSQTEASAIFRRVNRMEGADDDQHEFDFNEFEFAMRTIATQVDVSLADLLFANRKKDPKEPELRYIERTLKAKDDLQYMQQVIASGRPARFVRTASPEELRNLHSLHSHGHHHHHHHHHSKKDSVSILLVPILLPESAGRLVAASEDGKTKQPTIALVQALRLFRSRHSEHASAHGSHRHLHHLKKSGTARHLHAHDGGAGGGGAGRPGDVHGSRKDVTDGAGSGSPAGASSSTRMRAGGAGSSKHVVLNAGSVRQLPAPMSASFHKSKKQVQVDKAGPGRTKSWQSHAVIRKRVGQGGVGELDSVDQLWLAAAAPVLQATLGRCRQNTQVSQLQGTLPELTGLRESEELQNQMCISLKQILDVRKVVFLDRIATGEFCVNAVSDQAGAPDKKERRRRASRASVGGADGLFAGDDGASAAKDAVFWPEKSRVLAETLEGDSLGARQWCGAAAAAVLSEPGGDGGRWAAVLGGDTPVVVAACKVADRAGRVHGMVVAADRAAPPAAGAVGAGRVCSLTAAELTVLQTMSRHVGELLTRNEVSEARRERLANNERLVRGLQGVASSAGLPELMDLVHDKFAPIVQAMDCTLFLSDGNFLWTRETESRHLTQEHLHALYRGFATGPGGKEGVGVKELEECLNFLGVVPGRASMMEVKMTMLEAGIGLDHQQRANPHRQFQSTRHRNRLRAGFVLGESEFALTLGAVAAMLEEKTETLLQADVNAPNFWSRQREGRRFPCRAPAGAGTRCGIAAQTIVEGRTQVLQEQAGSSEFYCAEVDWPSADSASKAERARAPNKDPRAVNAARREASLESVASVPVRAWPGGAVLGVLQAANKLDANGALKSSGFLEGDVAELELVATSIGIAIMSARARRERFTKEDALREVIDAYTDSFEAVGPMLRLSDHLQSALQHAAAAACRLCHASMCSIAVVVDGNGIIAQDIVTRLNPHKRYRPEHQLDEQRPHLRVYCFYGKQLETAQLHVTHTPIEGIAGEVVASRELVNLGNAQEHASFRPEIDSKEAAKTGSLLAFPVLDGAGNVLAVITVCNKFRGTGCDDNAGAEEDGIYDARFAEREAEAAAEEGEEEQAPEGGKAMVAGLVGARRQLPGVGDELPEEEEGHEDGSEASRSEGQPSDVWRTESLRTHEAAAEDQIAPEMQEFVGTDPFTHKDEVTLSVLAGGLSTVMAHQRSNHQLSETIRGARAVAEAQSLGAMAERLEEGMARVCVGAFATFYRHDEGRGLCVAGGEGEEGERKAVPVGYGLVGQAAKQRVVVAGYMGDASGYPRGAYRPPPPDEMTPAVQSYFQELRGSASAMAVPVAVQRTGELVGVLEVHRRGQSGSLRGAERFSSSEQGAGERFAEAVAGVVAGAGHLDGSERKARLYPALQEATLGIVRGVGQEKEGKHGLYASIVRCCYSLFGASKAYLLVNVIPRKADGWMRYGTSGKGVMGTPTGIAHQTLSGGLVNTFFPGKVHLSGVLINANARGLEEGEGEATNEAAGTDGNAAVVVSEQLQLPPPMGSDAFNREELLEAAELASPMASMKQPTASEGHLAAIVKEASMDEDEEMQNWAKTLNKLKSWGSEPEEEEEAEEDDSNKGSESDGEDDEDEEDESEDEDGKEEQAQPEKPEEKVADEEEEESEAGDGDEIGETNIMSSLILDPAGKDPMAMLLLCKYPASTCWGPEEEAALRHLSQLCQGAFKANEALIAAAGAKKPEEKQVHVSPLADWEKPEPETKVFKRVSTAGRRKSIDANWLTRPPVPASPSSVMSQKSMESVVLAAFD